MATKQKQTKIEQPTEKTGLQTIITTPKNTYKFLIDERTQKDIYTTQEIATFLTHLEQQGNATNKALKEFSKTHKPLGIRQEYGNELIGNSGVYISRNKEIVLEKFNPTKKEKFENTTPYDFKDTFFHELLHAITPEKNLTKYRNIVLTEGFADFYAGKFVKEQIKKENPKITEKELERTLSGLVAKRYRRKVKLEDVINCVVRKNKGKVKLKDLTNFNFSTKPYEHVRTSNKELKSFKYDPYAVGNIFFREIENQLGTGINEAFQLFYNIQKYKKLDKAFQKTYNTTLKEFKNKIIKKTDIKQMYKNYAFDTVLEDINIDEYSELPQEKRKKTDNQLKQKEQKILQELKEYMN